MFSGPIRPGTRGGQGDFTWAEVGADKDRENYLGHSINAPTGRWQKNKDVHWYNRDADQSADDKKEEMRRIKEAEEDALAAALGHKPTPRGITSGDASSSNAIPLPSKEEDPEKKRLAKEERRRLKDEKRAAKEERRTARRAERDHRSRSPRDRERHHRHHDDERRRDDGRSRRRSPSRSRSPSTPPHDRSRPSRLRSPSPPPRRHTRDRDHEWKGPADYKNPQSRRRSASPPRRAGPSGSGGDRERERPSERERESGRDRERERERRRPSPPARYLPVPDTPPR